jgi:hypothetical protein
MIRSVKLSNVVRNRCLDGPPSYLATSRFFYFLFLIHPF